MKSTAKPKIVEPRAQDIAKPLRCAVYARVSVADHQSNALTSVDVQEEACRAYIKSQRHLDWVLVEPAYTDDGVSGATLQRPGLRALLEDVRQDKIDVVVVHRLDRLSRVLDVTTVIPLFKVQGVALVSVCEPTMNTSTSIGLLSVHILTNFAQFEREIIGERSGGHPVQGHVARWRHTAGLHR
ncbi:recombinase family protein [Rhodoferax sp.]|uniref:recombinase family protein n=1 Tax=Rhodoferax sp. TaxID=50421 RepID=UPI002629BD58|nr:recombinase family protein [Rhodoferax sp.]MDD2810736.1 recombinase family protein [Rhodoferax sp.]MDD4942269.1 recombinase family protein [Rhodoferax sp.]